MGKELYFDILDDRRRELLPLFVKLKDKFYLAGGTGLALQIGHRDSVDFDFFTAESFLPDNLFEELEGIFSRYKIVKSQEDKDTLIVTIGDVIKISFLSYPYELIKLLVDGEDLMIASVEDIGAMKLSAIIGRSAYKDYVDLYFVLRKVNLKELLDVATKKFPTLDMNLILKSLVYFDDLKEEPIAYKHDNNVDIGTIKQFLSTTVKNYLSSRQL